MLRLLHKPCASSVASKDSGYAIAERERHNRRRSCNRSKMAADNSLHVSAFAHFSPNDGPKLLNVIVERAPLLGCALLEDLGWKNWLRHTCDLASF